MKPILYLIFCLLELGYAPSGAAQNLKKDSHAKPNIIFILTDDLGYGDIGVFYQNKRRAVNDKSEPWTFTPNIDQLANSGAQLTDHYCAAPVCAPSRASLLSGVHQGHSNLRDNQFDKALEDNFTIASVLKRIGYRTAAFGKWGLQGEGEGPYWEAHPLKRGFDYFLGYMRHNDGHEHYAKEGVYRGPKQVWENYREISKDLDKCYTADLWTAAAKKWIIDFEKNNDGQDPFFIYLAYETPHAVQELPTQAYPSGGGIHGGLQWLAEPGHMINTASGTADSWTHPDYAHATYDNDKDPATPEIEWPEVHKRFATAVRRIDSEVGDLMQLLKDLRIDDNTMVIFTSDNGPTLESYLPKTFSANNADFFNSFGPFDGIKRDCWEGGVRVPAIAAWPGHIPPHQIIQTPSASYDWLATLTDAAGAAAPVRTDGISLMPSLTGKSKGKNTWIYIEYFEKGSTPVYGEFDSSHRGRRRNQMQLIRFGDTAGVRYDVRSQDDDFEIYDVVRDPKQIHDLNKDLNLTPLQKRLKAKALSMRKPDSSAPRPYDNDPIPACPAENVKPGIIWKAYQADLPWIAGVPALKPYVTGTATHAGGNSIEAAKNGVLVFEGYFRIPQDGSYTFYLTSGSNAFLRLHDAAVIDADYNYAAGTERAGSIRLKAGLHLFRLYYRAQKGAKVLLNLEWKTPGGLRQTIPVSAFAHGEISGGDPEPREN